VRGIWVRLAIAGGLLVVAFIAVFTILNQTVYTPAGFIRNYLDALARHDVAAALAMAGPTPTSSAHDDFLVPDLLGELESFSVAETDADGDVHTVAVEYRMDGREGRTTFRVEPAGAVLGIFPTWGFAASPLARLEITVAHARDFTANGIRFVASVQDVPSTYLAFTPGVIAFGHDSTLLEAPTQTIVLGSPRFERTVSIDARANAEFTALVDEQVHAYLDDCAAQQRLFPVGCPFGQVINDRLHSDPVWSITAYPPVEIEPTPVPGEWRVPATSGAVRLQAEVQSIADGEILPFDAEMAFSVGFVVTFVGANEIVVTPELG